MPSLGMQELVIIFVIALVIFGPRKLPELGRSLGKSLSEFKRASNELRHTLDEEVRIEERQRASAGARPTEPAAPPAAESPESPDAPAAPVGTPDPDTVARGSRT